MTLEDALNQVDDSLPDGAWMEALCQMTGMDAGQVAAANFPIPGSTQSVF